MIIQQTKSFGKQKKKLHANQMNDLDSAVKKIMATPHIGEEKQRALKNIRVYKFKTVNQEYLLAHEIFKQSIILHALGAHENFYRDLKLTLKSI